MTSTQTKRVKLASASTGTDPFDAKHESNDSESVPNSKKSLDEEDANKKDNDVNNNNNNTSSSLSDTAAGNKESSPGRNETSLTSNGKNDQNTNTVPAKRSPKAPRVLGQSAAAVRRRRSRAKQQLNLIREDDKFGVGDLSDDTDRDQDDDDQGDGDYECDDDEEDDDDDDEGEGEVEDKDKDEDENGANERDAKEEEKDGKMILKRTQKMRRCKVGKTGRSGGHTPRARSRNSLQEQLALSGPAGVAAAAAIATVGRRRRPQRFETNPSVRKRQQTRLIKKLRACLDEYTARIGQQAVVLITMPGKTSHNFKVFGAQPLESVVRGCKQDIMNDLERAVLEQTPIKVQREDVSGKHQLPPLVVDGIPTPVEKMTQAQLRAFIPLMLKFSTGRGKPGWGKDSTKPPWWPKTLPWANVRSDAREEDDKQRMSWTTTLREIVTNCYKYHGREDMLPIFDEEEDAPVVVANSEPARGPAILRTGNKVTSNSNSVSFTNNGQGKSNSGGHPANQDTGKRNDLIASSTHSTTSTTLTRSQRPLGSAATRSSARQKQQQQQQQQQQNQNLNQDQNHLQQHPQIYSATNTGAIVGSTLASGYTMAGAPSANFMQPIQNPDGTVSLIQIDPANAQILTLPDGTQVRAVRLQTIQTGGAGDGHQQLISGELHTLVEPTGPQQQAIHYHPQMELQLGQPQQQQQLQQQQHHHQQQQQGHLQQQHHQLIDNSQLHQHAEMSSDGQIILTSEDGTQSCYPMSQLVSIPASMYQQFAASGQPLQILTADGTSLTSANAIQIHALPEAQAIRTHDTNTIGDTGGGGGGSVSAGSAKGTPPIIIDRLQDLRTDSTPRLVTSRHQESQQQQLVQNDDKTNESQAGNKGADN